MKKVNLLKQALTIVLLSSTFGFATAQNKIYLSATGDDSNDGTQDAPVKTLVGAWGKRATDADNIFYVNGTVAVDENLFPEGDNRIALKNTNLTILGVAGTNATLVDNIGDVRIFKAEDGVNLNVKDLTIQGAGISDRDAWYTGSGACFFIKGANLEVENVTFKNFVSNNEHGSTVLQVEALNPNNPHVTFKNCIFRDNISTSGNGGGVLRIQDCAVAGAKVLVENCAFVNNEMRSPNGNHSGLAVLVRNGTESNAPVVTLVNTTIANNKGGGHYGTVSMISAGITMNIINCTIKDNLSSGVGVELNKTNINLNILNSVIEGNGDPEVHNHFDLYCNIESSPVTVDTSNSLIGNTNFAEYLPPFGYFSGEVFDAFDETKLCFTPKDGSVAIAFGKDTPLTDLNINTDQLGNKRLFANGKCDAGAIEKNHGGPSNIALTTPDATFEVYQLGTTLFAKAEQEIAKIELFSLSGQVIAAAAGEEVSVANVNKGIYLIKVDMDGKVVTKKVVIE